MSLREYELLKYLVDNEGIALSRDKILNNVWNYDYYGDSRTIDSHIKKIRHKLGGKRLQTKDDEIIELYWKRDPKAIEETQTHYGEKLGRLSFGILENREDAQECVNDTYLRTWNSIPPTRPQFFFAYLAKICRFLCFDVLDHKNAQKRSALVVELTHEMQQCIPDSRNEDKVQGEQIGQNITAFLRTQSKQDRLLFMKRYWYGVSIKDLAQQMQISESSAKVRLHRIRGRLKKYLESEGIWI